MVLSWKFLKYSFVKEILYKGVWKVHHHKSNSDSYQSSRHLHILSLLHKKLESKQAYVPLILIRLHLQNVKKLALVILTLCMSAMWAGNRSRRWQQYTVVGVTLDGTVMSTFAEKDYVRYISHWATTFQLYDTKLDIDALEVNKSKRRRKK
jgi:hypothetical protein